MTKTASKTKKPLIAVIALVVAAALVFGGIQLFGHRAHSAKAGDILTFGQYPQTARGEDSTPIQWRVLAVEGNRALVISEYAIDSRPYNTDHSDVSWQTCSLRAWLNSDFINTAFSTREQEAILTTTVSNPDVDWSPVAAADGFEFMKRYHGTGCADTQDQVFLLSVEETTRYFSGNDARICTATAYAIAHRGYTTSEHQERGNAVSYWWLRSPGGDANLAALVWYDGTRNFDGAGNVYVDVRPALWVNLESGIF